MYKKRSRVRLINIALKTDARSAVSHETEMSQIVSVLRRYDNLHGVIVLLTSPVAPLTSTHWFLMEALLMYFGARVARNVVFACTVSLLCVCGVL